MSNLKNQIILGSQGDSMRAASGSTGYGEWAISIGKIEEVSHEENIVFVSVVSKESDKRSPRPIQMTFPFGGKRSILGGIPEKGDFCVLGQALDDSFSASRQPTILAYFPASSWMGHDHVMGSDLSGLEGMATPDQRANLDGICNRIRQKLRHLSPGNIIAASSQGSEFLLDESVLIANRRGMEIILRDADEMMITRSVAGHEVLAGVRAYKGPVTRVANILPTQMFSDGLFWETLNQVQPEDTAPITQQFLINNSGRLGSVSGGYGSPIPRSNLSPSYVFLRTNGENEFEQETGDLIPANLDPYQFLSWGGFCTPSGVQTSPSPDYVYGGRPQKRVGLDDENRTRNASKGGDALSEYRVEVNHVSDQTLPVTEITDHIDADRLPTEPVGVESPEGSPFLEFVLGSVVGNDPFSQVGRDLYGKPIGFSLFDGLAAAPRFFSAEGNDIGDHLAFLLRVSPLADNVNGDTTFSIDKAGRIKMVSQGDTGDPFNIQLHSNTGMFLSSDGVMRLKAASGFEFIGGVAASGYGLNFTSDGGVRIKGGSPIQEGSQQSQQPDLLLEGQSRAAVRAAQQVSLEAPLVSIRNANQVELQALTTIQMQAGEAISQSSKTYSRTTTGKSTEAFGGPIDGLLTNGPVREINVIANPATGFVGGVNDKYQNIYGDRSETFLLGNHTTQCVVGNLTYSTGVGIVTARSAANQTQWSAAGVTTTATTGNISETAVAGAITNQSTISSLYKTTGAMTVSGAAVLLLGGPGKVGPVVSGADLDPLTGLPLISLGMGSPGHILTTPS